MLLHFEKMGLAIFTTNTLYKHNFRAHLPSYKYLFHLLSLYYFLLEVNLLKNDMIKAISQKKKKKQNVFKKIKVIQYFFKSHFQLFSVHCTGL
jgi:hypothetical protein